MRDTNGHVACITAIGLALSASFAPTIAQTAAQPAPNPQSAPNPQLAAAQIAFEALPEAERKAIQTDLIWAGYFNGAASGVYGPLTFRAVNALKATLRGAPDGLIAPADRRALAQAAAQAREAVGFKVLPDERSGVVLGIPAKLLPRRDANPSGGSRWQSEDGKVTLDTSSTPPGETLQALFEKATGTTVPGRRITYKLLRPDFFVVTGETATGKFYRRLAAGPAGLRGFSVGYDKALAGTVDKLVIAIANSFEPFPSGRPAAPSAPVVAGAPAIVPVVRVSERFGVGIAVGERLVLTAQAASEGCRTLRAAGRPAKLRLKDEASGLALLEVEGAPLVVMPAVRSEALAASEPVVLVAYGETGGQRAAVALPGQALRIGAGAAVLAPLQPGQAGAAVFDRQGRLAGVVTADPSDNVMVAGVLPQRSHATADGAMLQSVLAKAGQVPPVAVAAGDLSTGAIVERVARAVVPIACGLI